MSKRSSSPRFVPVLLYGGPDERREWAGTPQPSRGAALLLLREMAAGRTAIRGGRIHAPDGIELLPLREVV